MREAIQGNTRIPEGAEEFKEGQYQFLEQPAYRVIHKTGGLIPPECLSRNKLAPGRVRAIAFDF
jgi:hypothetical protein